MAENQLEMRPIDKGHYSWRDHIRELMTLRYGRGGKQLADRLIGASEEDLYLNYLQRTYGTPPARIPTEERTPYPEGRPIRDMFSMKGGLSDFGDVDMGLMGLSGGRIPRVSPGAAATETALLGGDALGEYNKGNTVAAAIMGGLAGAPSLLRYFNPPAATRRTPVPDAPPEDPSRREAIQTVAPLVAGIGALAAVPGGLVKLGDEVATQAGKLITPTTARVAANVAQDTAARSIIKGPMTLMNNDFIKTTANRVLRRMGGGEGSTTVRVPNYEDTGGIVGDQRVVERAGTRPYRAENSEWLEAADYEITDSLWNLSEMDLARYDLEDLTNAEFDEIHSELSSRMKNGLDKPGTIEGDILEDAIPYGHEHYEFWNQMYDSPEWTESMLEAYTDVANNINKDPKLAQLLEQYKSDEGVADELYEYMESVDFKFGDIDFDPEL